MNRMMIVARLRKGAREEAEGLIANGPPFDPEEIGFDRHAAYLTANESVFLFEAPEVEWIVNDMIDDPRLSAAFDPWRKLADGTPRLARERFHWSREEASSAGLRPDSFDRPAERGRTAFRVLSEAQEYVPRQSRDIESEGDEVNRVVLVTDLRQGSHDEAEELLRLGPPFDPEALGLHRHAAYLTADEVVFTFEAPGVERILNDLLDDMSLAPAVVRWDKVTEGLPRIAYECFYWSAETNKLGVGLSS
jgi:hypothetical protein